jgi:chloramphenicol-sensitive protein RarD
VPADSGRSAGAVGTTPRSSPRRLGLGLGIGAYLFWGGMALYFPLLEPAGALEIIGHRIVWSLIFCLVALLASRGFSQFVAIWRRPQALASLLVAALLIAGNWTVYVYSVLSGHVLDAALGYFINPLVTILLAVLVLRERLRPVQWVALGIGAVAVIVITAGMGRLPWISLALAATFALYGLVKKRVGRDVAALPGLAVETALLTPFALGYLTWLTLAGESSFGSTPWHSIALMSAGIVTALPLIMFSAAARRLPLSVLGMLQYLGPLLQFLSGLLIFNETMPTVRWAGFALVWLALVLLSADGLRAARVTRLAR